MDYFEFTLKYNLESIEIRDALIHKAYEAYKRDIDRFEEHYQWSLEDTDCAILSREDFRNMIYEPKFKSVEEEYAYGLYRLISG